MDKKPILEDEIKTVRDDPLNYGPAIVRQICEELLERRRAEPRPPGDREAAEKEDIATACRIQGEVSERNGRGDLFGDYLFDEIVAALTAARAEAEKDYEELYMKMTIILDHITRGRLSKPEVIEAQIKAECDAALEREYDEGYAEGEKAAGARVKELEGAAREMLLQTEINCTVDCEGNYERFEIARDALAALLAKGAE